jgi:hypothetical protein
MLKNADPNGIPSMMFRNARQQQPTENKTMNTPTKRQSRELKEAQEEHKQLEIEQAADYISQRYGRKGNEFLIEVARELYANHKPEEPNAE